MADITVTAANVQKGVDARIASGVAGATITAGQVVYIDTADAGKLKPVDSDSATAAARAPAGIALNGASAGQPVTFQNEGQITIGGTVTVGVLYVASDTAGGIMPSADLETGDYVALIGIGVSSTSISLCLFNSGVAVP